MDPRGEISVEYLLDRCAIMSALTTMRDISYESKDATFTCKWNRDGRLHMMICDPKYSIQIEDMDYGNILSRYKSLVEIAEVPKVKATP